MDIILRNVEKAQLPLIRELAKVLGLDIKQQEANHSEEGEDVRSFFAEMDRRTEEYEAGTVGLLTLDELEKGARKAYSQRSSK